MRAAAAQTRYSWQVANSKKNRTPAKPAGAPVSRAQRSLMYVAGSILGFGIIAIVALLIGEAVTPLAISDASGIWSIVAFIPNIALPVAFVLLIVLLVITFRKRSQDAKDAGK